MTLIAILALVAVAAAIYVKHARRAQPRASARATRRSAAGPTATDSGATGPGSTHSGGRSSAAMESAAMASAAMSSGATARTFAGVEIRVGASACSAARALAGQAFLAHEAPSLPLDDCNEARCRCAFEKHDDRRQETRRWTDDGLATTIFSAAERRARADRRASES